MKPKTLLDKIKEIEAERAEAEKVKAPYLDFFMDEVKKYGVVPDPPVPGSHTEEIHRARCLAISNRAHSNFAILCSPKWYQGLMAEVSSRSRYSPITFVGHDTPNPGARIQIFGMPIMISNDVDGMVIADIRG